MLIVLSIFEDFGYFICPQTGIGLNSSVHSMGSILPVNTPEHPREHPCSKWREHPLNTPPANTGRMDEAESSEAQ